MKVYKHIYAFFMLIAAIRAVLNEIFGRIYSFLMMYWQMLRGYNLSEDITYIKGCKDELDKIPKHLSVIIGREKLPPQVISNLTVYALSAGVEHISFYDTMGKFALEDIEFTKYTSNLKTEDGTFTWSLPLDSAKTGCLKYQNKDVKKSIEVTNLFYSEGKPLVAEVFKDLYLTKNSEETKEALKDRKRLIELIDGMMKEKLSNLPDVDLAIICDKCLCTFGLLPWHSVFAEFARVDATEIYSVRAFTDVLYKYAKCKQNFGK